jgi:sterol desaturase/sphingolipid hydroxylase (fatty acid hydroxylase superfamily)
VAIFYVPMIWLGFAPGPVFVAAGLGLLYQFWLHAEWIPKLGWLELVLNTPSHHRVHHASNEEYLDRNYGGIFIMFDRMFGTFVAERDDLPCYFGLVTPLRSNNPIVIAFHEWSAMGRDLWRARSWRGRLACLIGPPIGAPAAPSIPTLTVRDRPPQNVL